MKTVERAVQFVSVAVFSAFAVFSSAALGQTCPNFNLQIIQQPPILIGYESWVLPPRSKGSMFTFGRCVGTLNQQELLIDWLGTQLRGATTHDQALIVTFPFIDGTQYGASSKLRFRNDAKNPFDEKIVTFLANAQELGKATGPPNVGAGIQDLQTRLKRGEKIEDAALNATSSARIPILGETGRWLLTVLFVSFLDVEPVYRYLISYSFDLLRPGFKPDAFFFRSTNRFLASAIREKFDSGLIPLDARSGTISLQFRVNGPTSMGIGDLELLRGSEAIASFPVSIYLPAEAR